MVSSLLPGKLQPKSIAGLPHFAALKHRDYRRTWYANTFGGAALWAMIVASSWLVLERSDSSGWVGTITFASMLPFLVVSPIGGVLADAVDRRSVVLVTFAGSILVGAGLAAVTLAGVVELWQVALFAFAGGTLRALQEPAIQSLIPNQVPKEDLLNAVTLNAASRHGARFFGMLVAAPLLAVDFIGVGGVLVLSAAFNGLAAIQMYRTATRSRGEGRIESGVLRSMVDGLSYIYSHHAVALFIILVAFHCTLTMSFESILPAFSREELGADDGSILGYLVMAIGAGALMGTLLLAGVRSERLKGQLLLLTGLASGLAPMVMAVSGSIPMAILAGAAMGAAQATFMALTNTYVQAVVPDGLRGRISSLYLLHAGGTMAFANLGYGFVADQLSAPVVFLYTGLTFVVLMVLLGVRQPMLRRVYRTGEVAAA